MVLGRPTEEGESPVGESCERSWDMYPSNADAEEVCVNQRGPSRKAKYYLATDSEEVP